jgi:hypothetical protein
MCVVLSKTFGRCKLDRDVHKFLNCPLRDRHFPHLHPSKITHTPGIEHQCSRTKSLMYAIQHRCILMIRDIRHQFITK